MNRLYPFAVISSAFLLLCAGLVSCSKDASDSASRGERLPEGRYPIEFTAEGVEIEPFTRATVDGDWNGVESVAVWIFTRFGNEVKRYSVTSSDGGKSAKLTSDDPFWWRYNGERQGVIAWYPYSDSYPSAWTVKADQSIVENYRASDLIEGRNTDLSFAERNDPSKNRIVFQHITSKIVVDLVAGPGVTLDGNTSVKFLNVSGVETGNMVTAYRPDVAKQSFHALLLPLIIAAGTPFIQVNVGSDVFVYTPSAERQLTANTSYTYTITVKAHGIEVVEAMVGEWTDGGSEDVAGRTVLAKYTADDVKKGDYIYKDGTTSDGGLRRIYSDGTMVCEATKPQPKTIEDNPVVGIVFWTPSETTAEGRQTPASLTDDKIMAADYPECTHGLAVALENISYEEINGISNYEFIKDFQKSGNFTHGRKSDFVSIASGEGATDNINRIYGYQNTIVLRAYNEYCTKNNRENFIARNAVGLEEFAADHPAPSRSTGWFIPSLKELHLLCYMDVDDIYAMSHKPARVATRDVVNSSLSAANGTPLKNAYYRSSSEYAEDYLYVYIVYFSDGSAFENLKWYSQALKAVCAF